ncbi:MAG: hypothetical protein AB7G04_10125, partial [Hyphomonadaceae bacterium]
SIAAAWRARLPEEVADRAPIDAAYGDHAIIDDDTSAPPALCTACHLAPHRNLFEKALRPRAVRRVKFGRVEVAESHFNPGAGIGRPADAKTIAVADITHRAAERIARVCRQRRRTRISVRNAWRQCAKHNDNRCTNKLQHARPSRITSILRFHFVRDYAKT